MFSEAVMATLFLDNFKMLSIISYNGKGDPTTYAKVFRFWIDFERVLELARS